MPVIGRGTGRKPGMCKWDRDVLKARRQYMEIIRDAEAVSQDQAINTNEEVMMKPSSIARELASLGAESAGYDDMGDAPRRRTRGIKIDFRKAVTETPRLENSYAYRPAQEFNRVGEPFHRFHEKTPQGDLDSSESRPTNISSHEDNDRAPLGEIRQPRCSKTHVRRSAAARNPDKAPKAAKEVHLKLHRDKVMKGDRPRADVAKHTFAKYLSENIKFNFENLKEFVDEGTAEHGAKLQKLNLGERKRQVARIFTFLQTDLSLREELTQEEFRKILDQIDEAEAKRAATEPSLTVAQRNAIKRKIRHTKGQKQLDSEARNRERKAAREAEDSLMASLGNFGLQPQQSASSADIEMS